MASNSYFQGRKENIDGRHNANRSSSIHSPRRESNARVSSKIKVGSFHLPCRKRDINAGDDSHNSGGLDVPGRKRDINVIILNCRFRFHDPGREADINGAVCFKLEYPCYSSLECWLCIRMIRIKKRGCGYGDGKARKSEDCICHQPTFTRISARTRSSGLLIVLFPSKSRYPIMVLSAEVSS